MAVGQTIALACDSNPTKVVGSERLLPRLQIMLDGYRKVNPATRKKLPVQSDVPELLVETAYQQGTVPYPSKVRYTPATMGAQTPR